MSFAPGQQARCSVCKTPIDIHQVVRGGVCNAIACRGTAARRDIEMEQVRAAAALDALARTQLPHLLENTSLRDADVAVIALPVPDPSLSPPPAERRERFRESLEAAVAAANRNEPGPAPIEDPVGHASVASAACGVCRGACCRYGGDSAFIDDAVVRNIRGQQPGLDDAAIIAMYMDAIPERTLEGGCILQGESGCALPPEHRSYICNSFFCRPLREWDRATARSGLRPTAIFALHEERVVRAALVRERA